MPGTVRSTVKSIAIVASSSERYATDGVPPSSRTAIRLQRKSGESP